MSENPKNDLPERSFEDRVLVELDAIRDEVAGLRSEVTEIHVKSLRFSLKSRTAVR